MYSELLFLIILYRPPILRAGVGQLDAFFKLWSSVPVFTVICYGSLLRVLSRCVVKPKFHLARYGTWNLGFNGLCHTQGD